MNHSTKALKGIIIHPWGTKRIYKVHHKRKIVIDRFPREIISDFTIELRCMDDSEAGRIWEINKSSPVIKNITENDKTLELLKLLEEYTYPVQVKVDACGNLVAVANHKEWVENWRIKAKKLAVEEYDIEGDIEIFQKFYEILFNEKDFLDNKNREAYWKLLFQNFKIAVPVDAEYANKESIVWDVIQLGSVQAKGTSKGYVSGNDLVQQFKSKDYVEKEIIDKAIRIYSLKPIYDFYIPRLNFELDIITDNNSRKLKSKKAFLELSIEEQFNYSEEISIIYNDEIA